MRLSLRLAPMMIAATLCATAHAQAPGGLDKVRASCTITVAYLQVEPYAIMLRKDDPAFKKLLDNALVSLIQSGQSEVLYKAAA